VISLEVMTSFSNQWNKEAKKDPTERIRESLRTQKPLKPTMETAKNRLGIQTQKLDTLLEKLKSKDRTLFDQIVTHLQNHDSQQSKMLSNELSQVRRTIKTISQLKMSLEQVHMRLESTIDIGDALTALTPAVGTLSKVKTGLTGLMPNVDTELGEISDVFSDIMVNANNTSDIGFAMNPSGGDMNNILAEASIVAEQRVTDNFPDVPMGTFNRNSRSSIGEHTE
jgi:division protein CdvB (Snf7/Vps24/ESCRT-III family)